MSKTPVFLKRINKELSYISSYKTSLHNYNDSYYIVLSTTWGNRIIIKLTIGYPFCAPQCYIEQYNNEYLIEVKKIINNKLDADIGNKILDNFLEKNLQIPNLKFTKTTYFKKFIYYKFNNHPKITDWLSSYTSLFILRWSPSQKLINLVKYIEEIKQIFNENDFEVIKKLSYHPISFNKNKKYYLIKEQ